MINLFNRIKNKKIEFKLPNKSNYLIFDTYSNTVEKYKGDEIFNEIFGEIPYGIFDITGSINIAILIKSFFTNFSRRSIIEKYIKTYIEAVSPKCVITNVDNNIFFYKIKSLVNYKVTTVSIQNGLGDKSILKNLKNHEGCDYIFTFSESYSNIFRKYVKNAKCIVIGSIKNNLYQFSATTKKHQVTYISNYTPPPKNNVNEVIFYDNERQVKWIDFYYDEIQLIKNIAMTCQLLKLNLTICGRTFNENNNEFIFYQDLLQDTEWTYISRSCDSIFSSYDIVMNSKLVLSLDSTLGYESLSRGIKTVFFPHRVSFGENGTNSFGWPSYFPPSGKIWTNSKNFDNLHSLIVDTINLNELEWGIIANNISNEIIKYDSEMYMLKIVIMNCK